MATDRQLELLNYIVADYIKYGEPVSSGSLLDRHKELTLSSATIRNEMVELDKEEYVYKLDSSSSRTSGRIPTNKGYEHYLKTIKTNPDSIVSIKAKLDKLFKDRTEGIDKVLKEAMSLINESTNTLTISKDNEVSEKVVDVNCYKVGEDKAVIIVVTSTGNVINNETKIEGIKFEEFSKAINAFKKRIKDTEIKDLKETLENLKEIISMEITGMEEKFQEVMKMLISKVSNLHSNYQGMNSLITAQSSNFKEQIGAIFKMIENNSIWDLITDEGTISNDGSGVRVGVDIIDGVSVVNKSIDLGNKSKQLTIVGSKNQDYEKLFSMLAYLEEKLLGGK